MKLEKEILLELVLSIILKIISGNTITWGLDAGAHTGFCLKEGYEEDLLGNLLKN